MYTTLDAIRVRQNAHIMGIESENKAICNSLQEVGLFCGERICKLRQNGVCCGIFRTKECTIMLKRELARLVKVKLETTK